MSKHKKHRIVEQAPVDSVQQVKIGIEPPPDHIFKYRKNRSAPAQDVWGAAGTISYIPQEAKYIEGEGNFVYHYKVPFPSETVAPVEAIYAMGGSKRFTMNVIRFFTSLRPLDIFTRKGRGRILTSALTQFNDVSDMMMMGWYLEDGYYSAVVKEIRKGVETFLEEFEVEKSVRERTSEIVGCFFEYDNAYRTRLQDLAGETKKEYLLWDLPKELEGLIAIQATREKVPNGGQEVVKRFQSAAKMIKWLWRIPKTKRAIKKAIEAMDFEKLKMTEAVIYHNLLYGDYDIQGKTIEERIKVLEGYHGKDQTKWPPRIQIMNNR